jgi:hypothetical protein
MTIAAVRQHFTAMTATAAEGISEVDRRERLEVGG